MLKVILDVDDVLNECNRESVKRLNAEYGTDFCLRDITDWGLMHNMLDNRLQYFEDPSFMRQVPMSDGAADFVKELCKISEVFIATAIHKDCAGLRIDQILYDFPDVAPENILIGRRKDILLADVLLDDAYHNILTANVRYPVLFDQPWNQNKTGVPRVSSYSEFLTLLRLLSAPAYTNEKDIVILIGPSASGKTSLAERLIKEQDNSFEKVISYTTRSPRKGEDNYHFISAEQFDILKKDRFFAETTQYKGYEYGTAYKDLLSNGKKKIAVMDINGALHIKERLPKNTTIVFVERNKDACIESILERRLSSKETATRISSLDQEAKNKNFCDYTIDNNGTLKESVEQLTQYLLATE